MRSPDNDSYQDTDSEERYRRLFETARSVVKNNHLINFSIYCGRETREQSHFNQHLPLQTRVNITEPSEIENRFEP